MHNQNRLCVTIGVSFYDIKHTQCQGTPMDKHANVQWPIVNIHLDYV